LKIAWYLSGNRDSGSSRMECFVIHDYLNKIEPETSIIRWSPSDYSITINLSVESELIFLKKNKFDLVVFQKVSGAQAKKLARLCKRNYIACVYILCDYLKDISMAKICDFTIVTSTNLVDLIKKKYPKANVTYCPYATEVPYEIQPVYDRPSNETLRIVYMGARRLSKKYSFLKNIENVCLITIGPYDNFDKKYSLTTKMNSDFVWFRNRIKSLFNPYAQRPVKPSSLMPTTVPWALNTVYNEMARCDIGVIPLLPDEINHVYGSMKSNSRLVAMWSLGLPTIVSPLRSYWEIVSQGENGFIARTPEDWNNYIKLLKDSKLREQIGKNARKMAYERFSFTRQFNDYMTVFNNAISKC